MIRILRITLIIFYGFAGSYHFINPNFYYPLIPDYLPYPELINYISGFFEIILALGIAISKTRLIAVKGIIALLIAFIPSHVYFITEGACIPDSLCVPLWIAWMRLIVIHPLLIIWVWSIRKVKRL